MLAIKVSNMFIVIKVEFPTMFNYFFPLIFFKKKKRSRVKN